jgi:hypothetical protein
VVGITIRPPPPTPRSSPSEKLATCSENPPTPLGSPGVWYRFVVCFTPPDVPPGCFHRVPRTITSPTASVEIPLLVTIWTTNIKTMFKTSIVVSSCAILTLYTTNSVRILVAPSDLKSSSPIDQQKYLGGRISIKQVPNSVWRIFNTCIRYCSWKSLTKNNPTGNVYLDG